MSHNRPPHKSIAAAIARLKEQGAGMPIVKRPSGPIHYAKPPPAKPPSLPRQSR